MGIGLLLLLIFSTDVLAASGGGHSAPPEEAIENQRGLSHFKRGYFELMPRGRRTEAGQELALAERAFFRAVEINDNFVGESSQTIATDASGQAIFVTTGTVKKPTFGFIVDSVEAVGLAN
jgi:hypothetical protein